MAKDFIKEILRVVKKTPDTQDGIKNLVFSLDELLYEADNDILALLPQRQTLVNLIRRYDELYKLVSGEDLLSPQEIADRESLPSKPRDLTKNPGEVPQVKSIKNQLRLQGLTILWKNPNFVLGVLAWILGILGGVCTIMGILTAVGVAPSFVAGGTVFGPVAYTTIGWGGLTVLLLMGCIITIIARGRYE